jgi:O-antigen/teichoic acid export membrane protein
MPARGAARKIVRRLAVAVVWASGFFLVGYFSVTLAHDVRVAMVVLAAAIIPFGATARSVLRGLARGGALGLAAGAGIIWGMLIAKAAPPETFDRIAVTYAVAAVFLAAAVASLFAIFAQGRRRRAQQRWEE